MRTAGLALLLVFLGISAPAIEGFRSPGGVLQLAQDAAREALSGAWAHTTDSEKPEPLPLETSERSGGAAASERGEGALSEFLAGSPWFCHGIDCPDFEVDEDFHLEEIEGVERRTYGATKWVSVRVKGVSYDKAMYDGFMTLFRFISGTNEQQAKIPMTAPVKTRIVPGPGPTCENDFIISFFIPFEFQAETPSPTEEGVYLEDVEPFTVYAASFGGRPKEGDIVQHAADLAAALSAAGVRVVEDYYFSAGYDPPFRLFNRHNEVWLVEGADKAPSFGDWDADYAALDVDVRYVDPATARLMEDWMADADEEGGEALDEDFAESHRFEEAWRREEEEYDLEEEEDDEEDYVEEGDFFGAGMDALYFTEEDYNEDADEERMWADWEVAVESMMQPCGHMGRGHGGAEPLVDLEAEDAGFFAMLESVGGPMEPVMVIEIGGMDEGDAAWPAGLMDSVVDDLLNLFRLR